MFDLNWLLDNSVAACVDFSSDIPAVVIFRNVKCMRLHALGEDLQHGSDFIIVGGFHDLVQAMNFADSAVIRDIHDSLWGDE